METWQWNTVQKTHPNLIFFFICSKKYQTNIKQNNKNKKKTDIKGNTDLVLHISVQSCYFLVVLRISAILWKKNKDKILCCCVHSITKQINDIDEHKTNNQQLSCFSTCARIQVPLTEHVQMSNRNKVFYDSPVCEPLWCKPSWTAWSHLSHNQESTCSTGALRKSIAQLQNDTSCMNYWNHPTYSDTSNTL